MVMADRLGQALIRAARTGSTVAVLFCDVDRFKQINDTQGTVWVIRYWWRWPADCRSQFCQADLVARFGGDEFVVLLEDIDTPPPRQAMAEVPAGDKPRVRLWWTADRCTSA